MPRSALNSQKSRAEMNLIEMLCSMTVQSAIKAFPRVHSTWLLLSGLPRITSSVTDSVPYAKYMYSVGSSVLVGCIWSSRSIVGSPHILFQGWIQPLLAFLSWSGTLDGYVPVLNHPLTSTSLPPTYRWHPGGCSHSLFGCCRYLWCCLHLP